MQAIATPIAPALDSVEEVAQVSAKQAQIEAILAKYGIEAEAALELTRAIKDSKPKKDKPEKTYETGKAWEKMRKEYLESQLSRNLRAVYVRHLRELKQYAAEDWRTVKKQMKGVKFDDEGNILSLATASKAGVVKAIVIDAITSGNFTLHFKGGQVLEVGPNEDCKGIKDVCDYFELAYEKKANPLGMLMAQLPTLEAVAAKREDFVWTVAKKVSKPKNVTDSATSVEA